MTVQSENERNKALVDEVFQDGSPGPPRELRGISASRLHSNRAQLPSLGRSTRRAASFRDRLPSVTDVFDFARFSYDNVFAEDAAAATKRVALAIGDGVLAVTCVHNLLGTYATRRLDVLNKTSVDRSDE